MNPNSSDASFLRHVPIPLLDLLTFHQSEFDPNNTINCPIQVGYLNVNHNLFDITRLICKDPKQNLHTIHLGMSSNIFLRTITLLVTRYHTSSDIPNQSAILMRRGGSVSGYEEQAEVPIASTLTAEFVRDRIEFIFGETVLHGREERNLNEVLEIYLECLKNVPCNASDPDSMYNFIRQTMLPCIQKIVRNRDDPGEDGSGVTKNFWGCVINGNVNKVTLQPIITTLFRDDKYKQQVLMAFIMENFARMSGIVVHPINGQHRMMVNRYLYRGVDPNCNQTIPHNDDERMKRIRECFYSLYGQGFTNNVSFNIPLGEIDDALIRHYSNKSAKLCETSKLAHDHRPLIVVSHILDGIITNKTVPFFNEARKKLLDTSDVDEVSKLFDEYNLGDSFRSFCDEQPGNGRPTTSPKDKIQWLAAFWVHAALENIRTEMKKFPYFRSTNKKRIEAFENPETFHGNIKHFCKIEDSRNGKIPDVLFMFRSRDHHSTLQLFKRMLSNKNMEVRYQSLGDFNSFDYEVFQFLLLALHDSDSHKAAVTFCRNTVPAHDQLCAPGGSNAEVDKRLMSTLVWMLTKVAWAVTTHLPFVPGMQNVVETNVMRYTVAAETMVDAVKTLKDLGNHPELEETSFLARVLSLKNPRGKYIKNCLDKQPDTDLVPQRVKDWLKDQFPNNLGAFFTHHKVFSLMEDDLSRKWEVFPIVAAIFSIFLETYCEPLCVIKDQEGKNDASRFLKDCVSHYEEGETILNWAGISGIKLQPSQFIKSLLIAPEDEDMSDDWKEHDHELTPTLLGNDITSDNYFSVENVVKKFISVYLNDSFQKRSTLDKFMGSKEEEPDHEALTRNFVDNAPEFCDLLHRYFSGNDFSAKKKKIEKICNDGDTRQQLTDEDKKRISVVMEKMTSCINRYKHLSIQRSDGIPLNNAAASCEEDRVLNHVSVELDYNEHILDEAEEGD